MSSDSDHAEGERFGRYLIGRPVAPDLVDRYVAAIRATDAGLAGRDARLLSLVERHPRLLGLVDGGLALRRPGSVIRTRLLIMSAILEATPEYMMEFDPVARSRAYVFRAAYVAVRAGCKGLAGALLVTVI